MGRGGRGKQRGGGGGGRGGGFRGGRGGRGGGGGGGGGYRGRGSRGGLGSSGYMGGGRDDSDYGSFSLWDEARYTDKHPNHFSANVPLRDMRITFIPAGTLNPTDLLKPMNKEREDKAAEEAVAPMENLDENPLLSSTESPDADESEATEDIVRDVPMGKLEIASPPRTQTASVAPVKSTVIGEPRKPHVGVKAFPPVSSARQSEVDSDAPLFMVDVAGDENLAPKHKKKVSIPVRAPSPARSESSSGEEIVFRPRGVKLITSGPLPVPTPAPARNPAPPVTVVAEKKEKITFNMPSKVQVVSKKETTVLTAPDSDQAEEPPKSRPPPQDGFISLSGKDKGKGKELWNGKRSTEGNKRRKARKAQEDREAVEDYLNNIAATMRAEAAENGEDVDGVDDLNAFNFSTVRDLPGGDEWVDDSSTDEDEEASDEEAVERYKNDWFEDELEDFDAFSTDAEGVKGTVDAILRKRTRPSGEQYLIRWSGESTDDATWVLKESLDSSANALIEQFESALAELAGSDSSSSTGSESGDELEDDEEDSSDDDAEEADMDDDLRFAQRLQARMDLGLDVDDMDIEDDIMELDDDFFPMGKRKTKKKKKQPAVPLIQPDKHTGRYPSASAMADSFDLMDWSRPSIASGVKKKSKKSKPTFQLSDSELEANLQATFAADREKKKARKAEREALRAQGLLGKQAKKLGKPDLSAKFKTGMTMTEVFEEIRAYMLRDHDALPLPPMDKRSRKIVHELAGKLNLKSKSVGAGHKRFCTLYKTQRSCLFEGDEEAVDSILRSRVFLRRMDKMGVKMPKAQAARGGGGVGTRRRDGELVGANAPVIGAENKGRRMLEKMGYVQGQGLGAHGTGTFEPVIAVVKVSRAGLG